MPLRRALMLLIAVLATTSSGARAQDAISLTPAARMALGVETALAARPEMFANVRASALVTPAGGGLQTVPAPFGGVVVRTLATPGTPVETGDALAVVYSPAYAAAKSELETLRMTAEHMSELAERAERLHALGLFSRQETEEARHDAASARLALAAATARLSQSTDGEGENEYVLTAPRPGVVSHMHAGVGDAIAEGAPAASVFGGEAFWARAQLPARFAGVLAVGGEVRLANALERAAIVGIDPEIDPDTRALIVIVALPGRDWRLGEMIDLEFEAEPAAEALAIPARAIVRMEGGDIVFVETEGGFRPTPVDILSRSRDEALVKGGLAAGDRVAVSGLAALKNIAGGV